MVLGKMEVMATASLLSILWKSSLLGGRNCPSEIKL